MLAACEVYRALSERSTHCRAQARRLSSMGRGLRNVNTWRPSSFEDGSRLLLVDSLANVFRIRRSRTVTVLKSDDGDE